VTVTNKNDTTAWIKEQAYRLGFDFCGVAKVQKLDDDARRLENWLSKGIHGLMHFMERYFEMGV